jgi:UDP-N-acetylmuramate--alanine ligase
VYLLDIYAARETDTLGVSGSDLARELALRHPSSIYTPDADAVVERVAADAEPGDVIVTMGAGDVYLLAPRIVEALQ